MRWTREELQRITPEMTCPCCGVLMLHRQTIRALLDLEHDLGVTLVITSGYRCPNHNVEVGGDPMSRHLDGFALDIGDPDIDDFYAKAKRRFNGVRQYKLSWHLQVPFVRGAL